VKQYIYTPPEVPEQRVEGAYRLFLSSHGISHVTMSGRSMNPVNVSPAAAVRVIFRRIIPEENAISQSDFTLRAVEITPDRNNDIYFMNSSRKGYLPVNQRINKTFDPGLQVCYYN
jgi:hypothetical protein